MEKTLHKIIDGCHRYTDEETDRWYNKRGQLHRNGGPAVIKKDGYMAWWVAGRRHRSDGPAMIYADGSTEWFMCGLLHNDYGPAKVFKFDDGTKHLEWWKNGELHREDGPAVKHVDGKQEWWLYGKKVECNTIYSCICKRIAKKRYSKCS